MQANEPTSSEYNHIACDATKIVTDVSDAIVQFTKYMRRMYMCSDADNSFLAGALENMTRSLANLGSDVERVRLYTLSCETEADLREQEDQLRKEKHSERPE